MVFCSLGKIANVHSLGLFIFVSLSPLVMKAYATDNIQFNTDVLDVRDRKNIDLSQFSRSGYIMPEPTTWLFISIRILYRSKKFPL